MDHPNIARVLDAGSTDTGRPFFVMELVRGIKITEYCDQNKLSTEERLKLFIQVCHAIQHAHQKGIIHRDIKPSNILVTLHDGVPVPKVIDFGIAKATQGVLTDKTIHTQFQQFIGTPAYISPEQAWGKPATERSDLYAFGVVLFEMLCGRLPFIPEGDTPRDMALRRLNERAAPPSRYRADIPPALEAVMQRCLELERAERYHSATEVLTALDEGQCWGGCFGGVRGG